MFSQRLHKLVGLVEFVLGIEKIAILSLTWRLERETNIPRKFSYCHFQLRLEISSSVLTRVLLVLGTQDAALSMLAPMELKNAVADPL